MPDNKKKSGDLDTSAKGWLLDSVMYDANGNVVDPEKIVLDPDWLENMENPGQGVLEIDAGEATGEDYHPPEE